MPKQTTQELIIMATDCSSGIVPQSNVCCGAFRCGPDGQSCHWAETALQQNSPVTQHR
jgi:hypothetical protein